MEEQPKSASEDHWEQEVAALWESAQKRHQGKLKMRPKREALWLWKPLHWCLRLLTLGRSIDLIDGNYYCLFGRTLWLPGDGDSHEQRAAHLRLSILSHEIDHLDWLYFRDRDARYKTPDALKPTTLLFRLLHQWKYFCWPLPFWYARYREQIEIWGHERNLEQHLRLNNGRCARWYRKWLVMQFSSVTYAWICSQARAYDIIDAMIERVEKTFANNRADDASGDGSEEKEL